MKRTFIQAKQALLYCILITVPGLACAQAEQSPQQVAGAELVRGYVEYTRRG